MRGKGSTYRNYPIHGDSLASIREGFAELAMPRERWDEAYKLLSEVLETNQVSVFRWYKTAGTNELSCYWDDASVNMVWVTAGDVHIAADTPRPSRPTTWQKAGGSYVGWLLPGAHAGTGGGLREPEIAGVLCPETFVRNPLGTLCPTCEVIHG